MVAPSFKRDGGCPHVDDGVVRQRHVTARAVAIDPVVAHGAGHAAQVIEQVVVDHAAVVIAAELDTLAVGVRGDVVVEAAPSRCPEEIVSLIVAAVVVANIAADVAGRIHHDVVVEALVIDRHDPVVADGRAILTDGGNAGCADAVANREILVGAAHVITGDDRSPQRQAASVSVAERLRQNAGLRRQCTGVA